MAADVVVVAAEVLEVSVVDVEAQVDSVDVSSTVRVVLIVPEFVRLTRRTAMDVATGVTRRCVEICSLIEWSACSHRCHAILLTVFLGRADR